MQTKKDEVKHLKKQKSEGNLSALEIKSQIDDDNNT